MNTHHHDDDRHVHPPALERGPVDSTDRTRPPIPAPPTGERAEQARALGATITRLRVSRRLRQADAAEQAEVSERYWRRLEKGERVPSLRTMNKVIAAVDHLPHRPAWTTLTYAWWLAAAGLEDQAPHVRSLALKDDVLEVALTDLHNLDDNAAMSVHAGEVLDWAVAEMDDPAA